MSSKQKAKKKKGGAGRAERARIQKELWAFNQTVEHGFPNKPSALGYDPQLRLMAIGTSNGVLKVYGKPGVEFIGCHQNAVPVTKLFFLPGQGRIVSWLSDNTLHLWEINDKDDNSILEEVQNCPMEGKLKKVSVCCLSMDATVFYVGTESGNIFMLDIAKFESDNERIIYQDVVMQNVPDDYKVNPGPVEAICQHPTDPEKLLIGYNRGLIVIWDSKELQVDATFVCNQQLESLCWRRDGAMFSSSHSDGSYTLWDVENMTPAKDSTVPYAREFLQGVKKAGVKFSRLFALRENGNNKMLAEITRYAVDDMQFTKSHKDSSYIIMNVDETNAPFTDPIVPYGPFPCKAIPKFLLLTSAEGDFNIFSGAMPRASFGDHNVVNVFQEDSHHVAFDFTSKIIDFFVMCSGGPADEYDKPHTVGVLCEEELVFIDLTSEGWPCHSLPYLSSLHASSITSSCQVSNVPSDIYEQIVSAGEHQMMNVVSRREWPLDGGQNLADAPVSRDLLLTGHEDGSLKFWDCSSTALRFLYKLSTANILETDVDVNGTGEDEEEWPPFRKAGLFDPFSDDPRLGITQIVMCPLTGMLVLGGSAGQVMCFQLADKEMVRRVESFNCRIVGEVDGFIWKGHGPLDVKSEPVRQDPGFHCECVAQAWPPAGITAMAFQSLWGVGAFGTSHGFAVFDSMQHKPIFSQCTLNPNDLSATGEAIQRKKSLKKSLRASIRRLRKGRQKADDKTRRAPEGGDVPPAERRVEARSSSSETMVSLVRCLYFANSFIRDGNTPSASLWVGTNSGIIYVFTLDIPVGENRVMGSVLADIAKEVKLKHGAPVVSMAVVDGDSNPIPDPIEIKHQRAKPPTPTGHQLIVCSEEQFKAFSMPNLKPLRKVKLTAQDGSKVRKVAFVNFRNKSGNISENAIVCCTNLGEIAIFGIDHLKKDFSYPLLSQANVAGIMSLVFTSRGEGFYLLSPSEFSRFSISTRNITEPQCVINISSARDGSMENRIADVHHQGKTSRPTANGDAGGEEDKEQTVEELVNEVDELLAKSGINVSIEGDTEENIDMANITIDEVREFEKTERHEIDGGYMVSSERTTMQMQKTTHTESRTSEHNGVEELEELQIQE
ncbi:Lethal(2) giant larvae protein-like 2 [Holothuria leucospilota]|uniref:Lethal(2) giant larvae protein-like 2 n=1 Tax=Holothuria leucospilota TaxID=206669 RepID=A0A9Q1C3G0_HOLLE|nr:Lethal(2) giant larvae protein-like 2 [Holothuria leucospilota]